MYQVELRGKYTPIESRKEDILTSNVFSFFKYSDRAIFLNQYLKQLGLNVNIEESRNASFAFWPRYEDNTEPDLVIIVGPYYLLVEAKYFSDFGVKTDKSDAQLIREINGGLLEAKNYEKQFVLIAITADHIYKDSTFAEIPEEFRHLIKWTNWQKVAFFLNEVLNGDYDMTPQERAFALDLYTLLDYKKLRDYQGAIILYSSLPNLCGMQHVFFKAETARFRGDFIGFTESLVTVDRLTPHKERLFFINQQRGFRPDYHPGGLQPMCQVLFFEGGKLND